MGEKLLYYGWQGSGRKRTFLFGSTIDSILANRIERPTLCRESLSLYLRYGYVPSPKSIFKEFKKLNPGSIVTISPEKGYEEEYRYWNYADYFTNKRNIIKESFQFGSNCRT